MSDAVQNVLYNALQLFQKNQFSAAMKKAMTVTEDETAKPWQKAKAYYLSSVCEYYQRHYQTALTLAKKSVDINSTDFQSLYFLGLLYASTGDSKIGEKFYRQSIAIKPDYTEAWKGLVYCKQYTNNKDQDITQIKTLIDKGLVKEDHGKSNLYFALGKIYDDLKAYKQAIECYCIANFLSGKRYNNGLYEIVANKIMPCLSNSMKNILYQAVCLEQSTRRRQVRAKH